MTFRSSLEIIIGRIEREKSFSRKEAIEYWVNSHGWKYYTPEKISKIIGDGYRRKGFATKGIFIVLCLIVFLFAAIYAKKGKILKSEKPVCELPEKEIKEDFVAVMKPEVSTTPKYRTPEKAARERDYWEKLVKELKVHLQRKNEELKVQLNRNLGLEDSAKFYEEEYLDTRTTYNKLTETSYSQDKNRVKRINELVGKVNDLSKKLNLSEAERKAYKADIKNLFEYWDKLLKEAEPDEMKRTMLAITESKRKMEEYAQNYEKVAFGSMAKQKSYENKRLLQNEERKLAMEQEFWDNVLRIRYRAYFAIRISFEESKETFKKILG